MTRARVLNETIMIQKVALAGALVSLCAAPVLAQDSLMEAPPGDPYQPVSELVELPDFLPGLGTLYVDPDTLPAGPFLGYDHDGKLAATIYMPTIEELENGTSYDDLDVGDNEVSSVDIYYNAGHPGVEKPHIHVVLYHGDDAKSRVAQ